MRLRFYPLVVLTAIIGLGSCMTHALDEDHDHDTGASPNVGRLVLAQSDGTISVLVPNTGAFVAHFTAAAPAGSNAVYANAQGSIAYIINRAEHKVLAVHSGQHLDEHDGHEDLELEEPEILGSLREGLLPTHFNSIQGRTVVYNDQSGTLSVIDEHKLEDLGLQAATSFAAAREDHGAMVLLPEAMLVGYLSSQEVHLMDYDGTVLQTFSGGASLHGQARLGRYSAFGLADGVLLITQTGSDFQAEIIPEPIGTAEDVRVATLASHPVHGFFVANFGQGIATVSPTDKAIVPVELPSAPWKFGFDRSGSYIVVLGQDGKLYVLDAATRELHAGLSATQPRDPDAPSGTPVPALALGNRIAYLSDPQTREVLVVHLDDAEIEARVSLTGSPITGLALLATDGVVHE